MSRLWDNLSICLGALTVALVGASSASAQLQPVELTEEQAQSFDPLGQCEQDGRSINMHRVMFLENQSVDIDGPNGELRVSINRTDLVVEEIGSASGSPIHQ
jgi:hypothetical protein